MKLAVILLLLVFSLAACSSDEPELTEPEEVKQENESEESDGANTIPPQNQNLPEAEETNQTPSTEENEEEENGRNEREDDEEPEDEGPEEEEEPEQVLPEEQNETQEIQQTNQTEPPEEKEETSEQEEDENDEVKVKEVTLTQDERGDLKTVTVSREVLEKVKMTENPGYTEDHGLIRHSGYSGKEPPLESLYIAYYGYDNAPDFMIMTLILKTGDEKDTGHYALQCKQRNCADVFIDAFALEKIDVKNSSYRFLQNGRTLVYVRGNDKIEAGIIEDVANKLSQRLGMEIVDFREVLQRIKLRNCNIQNNLECTDYFVNIKKGKIELALKNNVGSEIEIKEVAVTSDAIIGRKCTTGQIDKRLLPGSEYKFELNLTETGSRCEYDESSREKTVPFLADPKVDLYSVSIKHTIQSRPEISFITGGAIITKKP